MISNTYLSPSLILQTLQQLRDVYGESVDKVIQGNVENIVFLKSTDEAMIEQLVKMSGTTHEARTDQKTITRDNEKLLNKTEGKISYTVATKERPVIEFNDFMFIKERNSIILKAGGSPLWNHNETAYPMSWRLFKNQIGIPGRKFSLQTIPTNSTAKDFDVRKNQPDFFDMLDHRLAQARKATEIRQMYLDQYGLTETDLMRLDQNVVADDIMHAINADIYNIDHRKAEGVSQEDREAEPEMDDLGNPIETPDPITVRSADIAEENEAVKKHAASAGAQQAEHMKHRFAGGNISKDHLVSMGGQVNRQLSKVLAAAYEESMNYFGDDVAFRFDPDSNELRGASGQLYVRNTKGADRSDMRALEDAESDPESRIYGEDGVHETYYDVTDDFIKYLASLDSWEHIAQGHFEMEASKAYHMMQAD